VAHTVAMYRVALTPERPPQVVRTPRKVPESRFMGATPTRAARLLRSRLPSSGSSASKVTERTGPTPGTLWSNSSFSRQRANCCAPVVRVRRLRALALFAASAGEIRFFF
jgi:hypothetical protein